MKKLNNIGEKNIRYNLFTILIYIIGFILMLQLFNLQILHGDEYLAKSSSRLTRETTIKAARGNIADKDGNILAGVATKYTVELYRSKIDTKNLNDTILSTIKTLENNGDKYNDKFPIQINPIQFTIMNQEDLNKWLKNNSLDENLTAEEALYKYKEKYNISNENIDEVRKIIGARYGIDKDGYSSMKPYVLADNISMQSVALLEEGNLNFPGIAIKSTAIRDYANGSLAAHVLGYVGLINEEELSANTNYGMNDYIGKTGIEYVFEKYLRGEDGIKQVDMSIDGTTTGVYITKEAVEGDDVVLTIDAKIQAVAENALKNNIEKIKSGGFGESFETNAGSVVVINVKTGEILALASYPTFEPEVFFNGISTEKWNEYTATGESALINRSIQSAYAPGSIFKMVTAMAGLETGAITPEETITDLGVYPGGSHPVCWLWASYRRTHGALNVSNAIKESCNFFFYEVGNRVGIENIEKYASYFGLGEKTNVELPAEVSGTLAGKKLYTKLGQTWYDGTTLSAAIGQAENNFSPIQMAKYLSIISNGGKNIDVSIVKDIINADGTSLKKEEITQYVNEKIGITESAKEELAFKEENLKAVLEGMKSVTTETGGTAYSTFKNFSIDVGGKTGSAEAGDKTNAWFAGFAPYSNPEIAVIVSVENGGHGSYTAEVARKIFETYFGIE